MASIVVLGAKSPIGRAIIAHASSIVPIKAVARNLKHYRLSNQIGIKWYETEILNTGSLDSILDPGDLVINLIYMHDGDEKKNSLLLKNIIDSCYKKRIARLIHCSTAVVVGVTKESKINETTFCLPLSGYERTKYNLEQYLYEHTSKLFDIGILRPTAVVGPGAQNLLKLASDLRGSSWIINYLRASLYQNRPMHLMPLRNVAEALMHLALYPEPLDGNIYIASLDMDPTNTFRQTEECLMQAMGLKKRKFPLIPIPKIILSIILRVTGKSCFDLARNYDSSKLMLTGFVQSDSVKDAIRAFSLWEQETIES